MAVPKQQATLGLRKKLLQLDTQAYPIMGSQWIITPVEAQSQ
jgi:hypothetical protein